jgi:hypothetical protein
MGEGDSTSAAVSRARSYFLVSAMVGNSLTSAIGPKLPDDEETQIATTIKLTKINKRQIISMAIGKMMKTRQQKRKNTITPRTPLAEQPRIRRHMITRPLHYCRILLPVTHLDIENRSLKKGKGNG